MVFQKGWGKNKYGNRTTAGLDGYRYHSALEASVANVLFAQERLQELTVVKRQQHIFLYSFGIKVCEYWPDFTVRLPDGEIAWIEAKGKENPDWRIKLNLWRAGGPGKLHVWSGTWRHPKLKEIIIPSQVGHHVLHDQVFGKLF